MYRIARQTGILALGTGSFVYLYHQRAHSNTLFAQGEKNPNGGTLLYCDEDAVQKGRAVVPGECATEGPLVLQLQQVQVMFRHGARTPLHTIPKIEEAEYDPQFVMREHQASVFPYERLSCSTGAPVEWSDYEKRLRRRPVKGGACAGALTSYGKDQMYMLGQDLRRCYRDRLGLCEFEPKDVFILSSNIMRTVESARCVLAGIYGGECLRQFAQQFQPVKIHVTDSDYNILVPDAQHCEVLRKVNHSAMLHPDFIPGMKDDRIKVENVIGAEREKHMCEVEQAQQKVNIQLSRLEVEGGHKSGFPDISEHQQLFLHDPIMYPLYRHRGEMMEKVDRLWADVMARHPVLKEIITEPDMSVLNYLRKIEVEEFEGRFFSGYRFHFYFHPNPHFHNVHLCKEVYTKVNPEAHPPKSTCIVWKTCGSVLPDINPACAGQNLCECYLQIQQGKKMKCDCPKPHDAQSPPKSFFSWFVEPTLADNDPVGKAIKDEIWPRPLQFLQYERKLKNPWDQKLNFVFGRDDIIARITHGWASPPHLRRFMKKMEENATTIMYYAMTGQHEAERSAVSRLSAGPLLTSFVDQAERIINGDRQAPKLCLYSSHDSTMTGILEIFGIWDNKWPPFAADVRLELYKEVQSKEYYVRVLYCGKVKQMRSQSEDFVHWCDFKKAVQSYMVRQEDYKKTCSSDILEKIAQDILKHEEGELPERYERPHTPAGM